MGILVVLFWAGVPPAQAKRPMTIIDLLNVPSLRDPRLSPDGKQLLYVLAEADGTPTNASRTSGGSKAMGRIWFN